MKMLSFRHHVTPTDLWEGLKYLAVSDWDTVDGFHCSNSFDKKDPYSEYLCHNIFSIRADGKEFHFSGSELHLKRGEWKYFTYFDLFRLGHKFWETSDIHFVEPFFKGPREVFLLQTYDELVFPADGDPLWLVDHGVLFKKGDHRLLIWARLELDLRATLSPALIDRYLQDIDYVVPVSPG
ncbi:hypothetical protein [Elstera cyanobacteriorum]|uniref:hypothetical protein n=1 Tax=Elstera cyanobacteriorum TaxID=2022747 RepID=UPI0023572E2B|nr:hypothetical protein [Elstera cyanobacteriorum]MCK6441131.1 hypothetical protein [Elstera cyanobacteriorum]